MRKDGCLVEPWKTKGQESREDYLEALLLLQKNGPVRPIDVARHFGFSKPSVSIAMGHLKRDGLVVSDEKGALRLTDTGETHARRIYGRHQALTDCLIAIGVAPDIAQEDACRIEHVISEETFTRLTQLMSRLSDQ